MNLLNLLRYQLGSSLVDQSSTYLQEKPEQLELALNAALPSLMGMFMSKGKTGKGVDEIMAAINAGGYDGGLLTQPSGMFSGGSATNQLLTRGQSLAQQFLSDKEFLLTKAISKFGGIRTESAGQLNRMMLPLVLGVIGKQVAENKLDNNGLAALLSAQKGHIGAAIPQGYSGLELFVNPKEARSLHESPIAPPSPESGSDSSSALYLLRQIWPWAMGLVVLLFMVLMLKWLISPPDVAELEDARTPAKEETPPSEEAVPVADLDDGTHPASTTDISDWFSNADKPLDWNDIQFSGDSPNMRSHSRKQVEQLAAALREHPSAKIKVEVLASSQGIAELRAIAIKKALMDAGINKNRIDTAGKDGREKVLISQVN